MPDGTTLTPDDIEEEHSAAVVAVLTDGRALTIRQEGNASLRGMARLFRTLARFPLLAFIDFSQGYHGLEAIAGAHRIPVLPPEDAAPFLASGGLPPRHAPVRYQLRGDVRAWAAACALAPRPVDEETAFALRRALELQVSPWLIQALRREGADAGGLLDWPFPLQVELCDWLRRAEQGRGSLLEHALRFWRDRYSETKAKAKAKAYTDARAPWTDTLAERTLRLERALLDLWDRPDQAARELFPFLGTDLEGTVKRRASRFAPLEAKGTKAAIVLPWHLRDRPDDVRVMLQMLSFGEAAGLTGADTLRTQPGRLWLSVGLAAGLGLGAALSQERRFTDLCVVEDEGAWCAVTWQANGDLLATGGRGALWTQRSISRPPGGRVALVFRQGQVPCEQAPSEGIVVQRCGTTAPRALPRAPERRRRVAVVEARADHPEDRAVADDLLDTGAAEVVIRASAPADLDAVDTALGQVSWDGEDQVVILYAPGASDARRKDEASLRFGSGAVEIEQSTSSDVRGTVVLRGHTGQLNAAAWSPDGQRVVTASHDNTARVWRADGGDKDQPLVLQGHTDKVYSAVFSPDGQRIVTASLDKTARIWSVAAPDGASPIVLRGHLGRISFAAWSPDGRRVVTQSYDGTSRVWSADGSDADHPLVLRGGTAAAWSPDGQRIVTASQDNLVRVWNVDGSSGAQPLILQGHEAGVYAAAWSPDGQRIVTASQDRTARVWSLDGARLLNVLTLKGHEGAVNTAAWSPDGRRVVTASQDRTARVWSIDGSGEVRSLVLRGHEGYVISAAWSPDGRRVVTASSDQIAGVWYADGSGLPVLTHRHEAAVESAAWSPDGQRVITASGDGTAQIWSAVLLHNGAWNARTGECLTADERVRYFGEPPDKARQASAACGGSGREP